MMSPMVIRCCGICMIHIWLKCFSTNLKTSMGTSSLKSFGANCKSSGRLALKTSWIVEFIMDYTILTMRSSGKHIIWSCTLLTCDERLVFYFLFIPWLQRELDVFAEHFNNSKPRHNIHKALLHGWPNDIFSHPEDFDSRDFSISYHNSFIIEHNWQNIQVKVDPVLLAIVREKYAPLEHLIFRLVPEEFFTQAIELMVILGNLMMDGTNTWNIHMDLLVCFRLLGENDWIYELFSAMEKIWDEHLSIMELPLYIKDGGTGVHDSAASSSDAELDYYEFDWTSDE